MRETQKQYKSFENHSANMKLYEENLIKSMNTHLMFVCIEEVFVRVPNVNQVLETLVAFRKSHINE